jgi:hypothetical protein
MAIEPCSFCVSSSKLIERDIMKKKVPKKVVNESPAKAAEAGAKKPAGKGGITALAAAIGDPVPTDPLNSDDVRFTRSLPDPTYKIVTVTVTVSPNLINLSNFDFAARGREDLDAEWYDFRCTPKWTSITARTGSLELQAPPVHATRTNFADDEIVITIITKKKVPKP